MLLNGGELDGRRILRAETVAQMTQDQMAGIAQGPAYTPGPLYTFGLGVAVRHAARDVQPAGEPGDYAWSGAGGTYFWSDPTNQLQVVVMLQSTKARAYRALLRNMVYDALPR
jgi:CubicO group peptidase (beta-lactamase class C family)